MICRFEGCHHNAAGEILRSAAAWNTWIKTRLVWTHVNALFMLNAYILNIWTTESFVLFFLFVCFFLSFFPFSLSFFLSFFSPNDVFNRVFVFCFVLFFCFCFCFFFYFNQFNYRVYLFETDTLHFHFWKTWKRKKITLFFTIF